MRRREHVEQQVISAGHFHGMPLALAMSYVKAAIPVLASISERRLNKLVDPATNDGLPAFLIGNEDGTESGLMIVQYTAAAIVNDLRQPRACRRRCIRSRPAPTPKTTSRWAPTKRATCSRWPTTSARCSALELYTAAQALDLRRDMINAARALADRGDADGVRRRKCRAGRCADAADRARVPGRSRGLRAELADAAEFRPGRAVAAAHAAIRARIAPMDRDRALDGDVATAVRLVTENACSTPRVRR